MTSSHCWCCASCTHSDALAGPIFSPDAKPHLDIHILGLHSRLYQGIAIFILTMKAPRVALAAQSIPAYARTAGRAVHIKIYPRPRNLSESREILRVLQQYGEVAMYKHLKVSSLATVLVLLHR